MADLIIPKYRSAKINSIIELGNSTLEIDHAGEKIQGFGNVRLFLGQRERVIVTANFDPSLDTTHLFNSERPIILRFGSTGQPVHVTCIRSSMSASGWEMQFLPQGNAIRLYRDRRVRLQKFLLHLLNFPKFFCSGGTRTDLVYKSNGSQCLLGRIVLEDELWLIEIQELVETSRLFEQSEFQGGSAITHVLSVKRVDGKSFSFSAMERLINSLHRFLSFARGQWTSVFGPVGYDRHGHIAYEAWGSVLSAPNQSRFGWFDVNHGECLAQVYPGFAKLLHHSVFGSAASAALYWYLRSNRAGDGAGVDSGLILSQAALERLALAILSAAGLPVPQLAVDRLRAACLHLVIPIALPLSDRLLQKAKKAGDFTAIPSAIVKVRNELVHPKRRLNSPVMPLVAPTWQLAQWCIEIMLLKLSGYRGLYHNRLGGKWVGEVENIP